MGLDMNLTGVRYLGSRSTEQDSRENKVKEKRYDLGYWRKHPDLHGYIIENFAEGVDDCKEIELSREGVETILHAVLHDDLPKTTGFFFGETTGEEKEYTVKTLNNALLWLNSEDKEDETTAFKYIIYQASW
jgi:hypothetical protein